MSTKIRMNDVLAKIGRYKVLVGEYPSDDDGLNALVTKPDFDNESTGENWCVLAKSSQLKDAWGNDIRYELVDGENDRQVPQVKSNGPDRDEDTEDDITRPAEEDDR